MGGPRKPWTQVQKENSFWVTVIVWMVGIWLVVTAVTKLVVFAFKAAIFAGAVVIAFFVLRGLYRTLAKWFS